MPVRPEAPASKRPIGRLPLPDAVGQQDAYRGRDGGAVRRLDKDSTAARCPRGPGSRRVRRPVVGPPLLHTGDPPLEGHPIWRVV